MTTLRPDHAEHLAASGITPDVLAERGYHTVTNGKGLDVLADYQRRSPGIAFTIYSLGEPYTTMLRPDVPRSEQRKRDDGTVKERIIKYEWPAGVPYCLDTLPRYKRQLLDRKVPLLFTEGAKKVDAIASLGAPVVPINVGGVWTWTKKDADGNYPLIPDFNRIPLRDRRVILGFDSDCVTNPHVKQALAAFAEALRTRGAIVGTLFLPHPGGDQKLGLDDAVAQGWLWSDLGAAIKWPKNEDSGNSGKAAEGWGSIAPLDTLNLPAFPVDALPDWLRAMVEAISVERQTPPDLAALLGLSVISTCCAGRVMCKVREGWHEPINVYTAVAMPPGTGKSGVFAAMTAPLTRWEREETERCSGDIAAMAAEREVLESRLGKAKTEAARGTTREARLSAEEEVGRLAREVDGFKVPAKPRLIVDDVTPETLASMIADQGGRMAALSAEGSTLFSIMAGRYSGGAPNLGVFLMGHSGDALRVDRKTRTEYVPSPALTLGLAIQPDVLFGLSDRREFTGLGLLGRFLYALPADLRGRRNMDAPPAPADVRSDYEGAIAYLLNTYGPTTTHSENNGNSGNVPEGYGDIDTDHYIDDSSYIIIYFTNPAYEVFQAFRRDLEPHLAPDGELSSLADWAGKLAGAVARIAALLHCAQHTGGLSAASHYSHNPHNSPRAIGVETVNAALAIARYLIPHARAAYAAIGADPQVEAARRVLRWIETAGVQAFTKREAYQGTKGTFKTVAQLEPALELLAEHGYIQARPTEDRPGPGRKPSPTYDVHPEFKGASHNSHNSQFDSRAQQVFMKMVKGAA